MFSGLTHLAFIGPGGPEFIVIMLVLLLMFGAKDAPRIFRKINDMMNQLRNTADGFKREIMYGDLSQSSDTTGPEKFSPDDSGHDEDYDYDYDHHDEDYHQDELEREYSDETFMDLEKDLEAAAEQDDAAVEAEDEDGDAKKA